MGDLVARLVAIGGESKDHRQVVPGLWQEADRRGLAGFFSPCK